MNRQDDKKAMFDIMPADIESSDGKPSLSRRLINKTLQHAQDAVEFASDTSRNIAGKPVKLHVRLRWQWLAHR